MIVQPIIAEISSKNTAHYPNVSLIIYNVANAGSTFLQWENGFQYSEERIIMDCRK